MVVRVAQRVRSGVADSVRIVVAGDSPEILAACGAHGVEAVLMRQDHPSGSDRLAEASAILGLGQDDIVVNVQGDEPLIDAGLVESVAALLVEHPDTAMGTAAHAIASVADFTNPNIVKVVLDAAGLALYFSRAPIPWWRDGLTDGQMTLPYPTLRLCGTSAFMPTAFFFTGFPHADTRSDGEHRGPGTAACHVARLSHLSACDGQRARSWRGHPGRFRPGAQYFARVYLSSL